MDVSRHDPINRVEAQVRSTLIYKLEEAFRKGRERADAEGRPKDDRIVLGIDLRNVVGNPLDWNVLTWLLELNKKYPEAVEKVLLVPAANSWLPIILSLIGKHYLFMLE